MHRIEDFTKLILRQSTGKTRQLLTEVIAHHGVDFLYALENPEADLKASTEANYNPHSRGNQAQEQVEAVRAERDRIWREQGGQLRPENVGKANYGGQD